MGRFPFISFPVGITGNNRISLKKKCPLKWLLPESKKFPFFSCIGEKRRILNLSPHFFSWCQWTNRHLPRLCYTHAKWYVDFIVVWAYACTIQLEDSEPVGDRHVTGTRNQNTCEKRVHVCEWPLRADCVCYYSLAFSPHHTELSGNSVFGCKVPMEADLSYLRADK